MKAVLLILYAVFVIAGTLWLTSRPPVVFVARQELPSNHLVQATDLLPVWNGSPLANAVGALSPGDLVGRYTSSRVRAGRAVHGDELLAVPQLIIDPTKIIVALPVNRDQVSLVNGDGEVRVCVSNDVVLEHASTRAVICPADEKAACSVLLVLPPTEAGAMVQRMAHPTTFTFKASNLSCK